MAYPKSVSQACAGDRHRMEGLSLRRAAAQPPRPGGRRSAVAAQPGQAGKDPPPAGAHSRKNNKIMTRGTQRLVGGRENCLALHPLINKQKL